jgi:hypothetical protein
MRPPRRRVHVLVLALATLAVVSAAASAGFHSTGRDGSTSSGLRLDFSGSTEIPSNCSLPAGSPFNVSGPGFVLTKDYPGGVEDFCSSHSLTGDDYTITYQSGYTAALLIAYASNVTVSDFQFAGPGTAVELQRDTNVTIADDTMLTTGPAVELIVATDVVAASLDANNTGGINCEGSSDVTVEGSYLSNSAQYGLIANSTDGLDVTGNDFATAQLDGVALNDDSDVTVQSNLISDEGSVNALWADGVSELNASGNNLTSDSYPVVASGVDGASFWANSISSGTYQPYEISDSSDVTIGNATALEPGTAGVELTDVDNATLRAVDSTGEGIGVEIYGGSDVVVTDSNLSNGNTGVYAVDVTGVTVLDSDLADGNNGLWAAGSTGILVAGSDLDHANYPINLTEGDANVLVTGSELDLAQFDGAYLDNVTNVSIEDSSVEWAANVGVVVDDSDAVTVSGSDFAGNASTDGPEAVFAEGGNGLTIAQDDLAWTNDPLAVSNELDVAITGSNVQSSSGTALDLTSDDAVAVSDDNFSDGTGTGIDSSNTNALTISGAELNGVADNGVAFDSSTDVAIDSSTINGVGESAVYASDTNGLLADNDTLANDGYAFFLQNDQSVTVVGTTALNGSDGDLAATDVVGFLADADNFSVNPAGDDVTLNLDDSSAGVLSNCTFVDDFEAVELDDAFATIEGNTFAGDNYSIDVESGGGGLVFHNDFLDDGGWVLPSGATVGWNDPYPIGGNYWSNYTGTDRFSGPGQNIPGSDGIGDAPFVLNSANIDYYPLMTPWVDHNVVFAESGLTAGTLWSVVLNGTTYSTTSNSIVVFSAVGAFTRFAYSIAPVDGFHPSPTGGAGVLGNGSVVIQVNFRLPTFAETFSVRGLPENTTWVLRLDGVTYAGPSQTATTVLLSNGSYEATVVPIPGYSLAPASYDVLVAGAAGNVTFQASPFLFAIDFVETGLPQGLSWNLAVNGTTGYSSSDIDAFSLTNGSYSFAVNASAGYVPTPATGTFSVEGSATDLFVHFAQPGSSRTTPPSGGSPSPSSADYYPYEIAIGVAAGVAAVGWVFAVHYRRHRGPNG